MTPEFLNKLFEKLDLSGTAKWSPEEQEEIQNLMQELHYLFALEDKQMGKTSIVKHKSKLNDYTPFKERYRYQEVCKHLKEMLEVGAIQRSNSPWASAVVLARKKDGSLQFCINLCKRNGRTIKDAYSLLHIDDTLDCLNRTCIFTSVDLKSSYWQVEIDEASKQFTAFTVGPLGFYECECMPFSLTNAPATFQRLMEDCLGDLHLNMCIIYLDDVIIFSKTSKEHLVRLWAVFEKFAAAGLKLKLSKCELVKTRIHYLGHVVSENGIECDPRIIEVVLKWPIPTTVTEVRQFLGFCNYYRRFIFQFAHIAQTLNKMASGDNANHKNHLVTWTD